MRLMLRPINELGGVPVPVGIVFRHIKEGLNGVTCPPFTYIIRERRPRQSEKEPSHNEGQYQIGGEIPLLVMNRFHLEIIVFAVLWLEFPE